MSDNSTNKKRSVYKPGSLLDFPQWSIDDKANSYRWLNAELLAAATDGYEPRGWAIAKDPKTSNPVRRGDLILGSMPIDKYREMKDYEDEMKRDQVRMVVQAQAEAEEVLTHDFKKKGGRTKFEFTQE